MLNQLRTDGLYTTFAAPVFSQHGGTVPTNYPLTISGTGGTIYFTTDGVTDPRLIGGGVNPVVGGARIQRTGGTDGSDDGDGAAADGGWTVVGTGDREVRDGRARG